MVVQQKSLSLASIKQGLTDTLVLAAVAAVGVALLASLMRIPDIGMQPVMYLHIVAGLAFLGLYLFRRRVPQAFSAHMLCGLFFAAGAGGIGNFGLAGGGLLLLIGAALFACFLLSFKVALLYASLAFLLLLSQWWLASHGQLHYAMDVGEYAQSGPAWLNVAVAFSFLMAMVLYLTQRFFDYLLELLAHYQDQVALKSQSLDDSKALLDCVVNAIPLGVLWKDKDGRYLGANKGFVEEMQRDDVGDIIGKSDFELTDADTARRYRELDQRVIESGMPIIDAVEKVTVKGDTRFISMNRLPLSDHTGNWVGVLCTYQDITQAKQTEMMMREAALQAEQASAAKTAFLANMSHELRTPINGIMGLLELCLRTQLTDKQQDYLHKAKLSARSLLDIVNDILDLAKIEAGQLHLEKRPFELAQMLDLLHSHVTPLLGGKSISFELTSDAPKGIQLIGDDTRLRQILLNLCSNAVKFTQLGFVNLSCSFRPQGNQAALRFSVKDSGIGIADDALPTLFDSFTQADNSTSRKFGGTGLGLSIVRQLVEKMGGSIEVNSKLGQGSEFVLSLTLPIVQAAMSEEALQDTPDCNLQDVRVLLVEDNAINLEICREMLVQQGAIVHCAENGEVALQAISAQPFDVVLMDIQMPVMDGCQAISKIRAQDAYADLPVIAVTANVLSSDIERYVALGFSACLAKPYEREKLLALVACFGKGQGTR